MLKGYYNQNMKEQFNYKLVINDGEKPEKRLSNYECSIRHLDTNSFIKDNQL